MARPTARLTALALVACLGLSTGCGGDEKPATDDKPAATQTTADEKKGEKSEQADSTRKTPTLKAVESIDKPKAIPSTLPAGEKADLPLPITMEALEKAGVKSLDEEGVEVDINLKRLLPAGTNKDEFGKKAVELLGKPDEAWTMAIYPGTKNEIEMVQAHWRTADGGLLRLFTSQFLREDGNGPIVSKPALTYLDAAMDKGWRDGDRKIQSGERHPDEGKHWRRITLK